LTRFQQGGQQSDLNEAIFLYRQALKLRLPPHPNQSSSLNNLANALWAKFEQGGEQSDLDEAIFLHRQALELFLPPHPSRSSSLNNLASALLTQFEQGGQQSDLNEAISLYRQALELPLPPHPNQSSSLHNLASALSTQFEQGGQQSDLDEAMSLFLTATQYPFQSPSNRLRVARRWIHCADRNQHSSAIDAYEASIQALPQVAALSLDLASRQDAMTAGSDGLARDAARCAIHSGRIDKAIELLEAGRSIFWSQVLSLRSPFDQLHKIAPELADKLRNIATKLEIGSHRDVFSEILDNRKKLSIDQEAARLNRLNEEWAQSIHKVRKLSGFEDFLRPSRLSSLKAAASEHPVVILIANHDESHCLIMTSTIIHHIPLPNLGTPKLKELAHIIWIAGSQSPISRSLIDQTQDINIKLLGEERAGRVSSNTQLRSSDDMFKSVLRMLWDELVKPVINFLDIKVSQYISAND
jgi:tetratricopeptide (TPR) repeat protein